MGSAGIDLCITIPQLNSFKPVKQGVTIQSHGKMTECSEIVLVLPMDTCCSYSIVDIDRGMNCITNTIAFFWLLKKIQTFQRRKLKWKS